MIPASGDLGRRLRGARVAVIDLETTGVDRRARIVSVGVAVIERLWETEPEIVLAELVQPGIRVPAAASRVHGLSDEALVGAPGLGVVWPRLLDAVSASDVLCAYNATFERRILKQESKRMGFSDPWPDAGAWLDPMIWCRRLDPMPRTLEAACVRRGVPHGGHTADGDALCTARLLPLMIREIYGRQDLTPPRQPSIADWLEWQIDPRSGAPSLPLSHEVGRMQDIDMALDSPAPDMAWADALPDVVALTARRRALAVIRELGGVSPREVCRQLVLVLRGEARALGCPVAGEILAALMADPEGALAWAQAVLADVVLSPEERRQLQAIQASVARVQRCARGMP